MGRSRYKIYNETTPHFLTCTTLNWIPLFTRPATVKIILDALRFRQQERDLKIYAYVILENHLHMIAQSPRLSGELASFKSYTAHYLIEYLKEQRARRVLDQLSFFKKQHKQDREHQVWEEGCHPEEIRGEAMLLQKIDYIHNNPVKRGYVDEATHWRYSSARNYMGQEGLIPVFMQWS
ncbi:MAG: REP element-mobilizing transposase RayT [Candidatus Kentron sp. G]|nr:MAG: REP element-mobilizing transposase RayT [Candidatus Kentron sp. G]VFM95972.1 MAG: REP element-mobilizing transposase RayT [Candidatus Kentron sp. G]VFM97492.1 MAG: REP element-mobilizing transposase RayT [Candidatus Kentron sp. G]